MRPANQVGLHRDSVICCAYRTRQPLGPAKLLMCCKKGINEEWAFCSESWVPNGAVFVSPCFYAVVESVKALNVSEERQAECI